MAIVADRNSGENTAEVFACIQNAYEVLSAGCECGAKYPLNHDHSTLPHELK
jgi:hypothetical protein